jgi:hypothetical protein
VMAHKSRQSERQVQRCLRDMLASGWLIKVRNGGGRGRRTEYRINPDWLSGKGDVLTPFPKGPELSTNPDKMSPFTGAERVTSAPQKGDICDIKRVTSATVKGDICDIPIRTIREPSIEIPPYPPTGGADAPVDNLDGFEAFFAAYPRKVGKVQAGQEWERLAPDAALRKRIVGAVHAWAHTPEWQRNGGQYVPKPARFLREARWDDVPGCALAPPPEQLKANAARAQAVRDALGLPALQRVRADVMPLPVDEVPA